MKDRFSLSDLAGARRSSSVEDLIVEAVDAHLDYSNFNNLGEVKTALRRMCLSENLVDAHEDELAPMMLRRHWIVHRADRNDLTGRGHHLARSIELATVETWRTAVLEFGNAVLSALP